MSQITDTQLIRDFNRLSKMHCEGTRARVTEVLLEEIEKELIKRGLLVKEVA